MKKIQYFVMITLFSLVMIYLIPGCEVGTNPLLFDGIPVEASFVITGPATSYADSVNVDLEAIAAQIGNKIDSISVYNITILIDGDSGVVAGTTATGKIYVNDTLAVALSSTRLDAFAAERSIFDSTLPAAGVTYGANIGTTLKALLALSPRPIVKIRAAGTVSASFVHFVIHVKLYTQIYTAA